MVILLASSDLRSQFEWLKYSLEKFSFLEGIILKQLSRIAYPELTLT